MGLFRSSFLLLLALTTAPVNGFRCTNLNPLICRQSSSRLFASLQEERKQMKVPSVDSAHHQSKVPSVDGAHQKSSYVRIQGIDKEQEKHHGHEQLHHYHNLVEQKPQHHSTKQIKENLSTSQQSKQVEQSHVLTIEEMSPIFQWTNSKGKTKVLNLYGLYNLFIIAATLPFWLLSMEILQRLGDSIEGFDDNRAKFDYSGKIWCRTYLRLVDSYPELAGDVSRLKDKENGGYGGACLFVANHASFLDIAVLCTVLDPVFKFIAKDSLVKFPGVGKQLLGGEHVLIDRNDKRSQLRSFKQAINYLKDGVPIMAFPEGARSPDGRLMAFKPGLFSMATKAKVPIVPLSIANAYAVMPAEGFVPIQTGKGKLRVYVHEPIEVDGKSEEQISEEVKKALLSELPIDQHPLEN